MSSDRSPGTGDQQITIDDVTVVDQATIKRAVGAAAIGNVTEWFDFGVYGYLTGTIALVFFPPSSGPAALLGAFATFAVAFLIRPIGGLILGPLGDRVGRTKVLSFTVIMMAIGTFCIGLIPGYSAIGVAAPILLVLTRLVQGFSTGGEYGGAMTFIAEYTSDRKRGFYGSWLEFGTLTGYVLGAGLATILTAALSQEALLSWGWRIPFFCALPLGLIGLYLRAKLEETPAFAKLMSASEASQGKRKGEFLTVFTKHWKGLLLCGGLVIAWNIPNYMLTNYMPTYLTDTHILPAGDRIAPITSQILQIIVLAVLVVVVTFVGRLSDVTGRKPILFFGCGALVVFSLPAVLLVQTGSIPAQFVGLLIMGLTLVCFSAVCPSTLPALFPTGIRYGGLAVSFNIFISLFAGTTSSVTDGLRQLTDNLNMPAFYLMASGVIGLIATFLMKEPHPRPLPGSPPAAATKEEARELVTEANAPA